MPTTENDAFWATVETLRQQISRGDMAAAQRIVQGLQQELQKQDTAVSRGRQRVLAGFVKTYDLKPAAPVGPGVSLVTAVRNRTENLLRAVPTWLACAEISEIIIVDWSSDQPVQGSLAKQGVTDPRIRVIRIEDEPRWILSLAFNAGFRAARQPQIIKVDADILLEPDFFAHTPLEDSCYVAGNWRQAQKGQKFTNGFFYVGRENLRAVNGFNEFITTYGWDDDDLYLRLNQAGLHRKTVDSRLIHHLPHDNSERLPQAETPPANAWEELARGTKLEIQTNRFMAALLPPWNTKRTPQEFTLLAEDGPHQRLRRSTTAPHEVPDHVRHSARLAAARHMLSWRLGFGVFALTDRTLDQLLTRKKRLRDIGPEDLSEPALKLPHINTPRDKLYVDAQHGLGNRLRAIASGMSVAQQSDRELVVIWEPDHHCQCDLGDLFQYAGPVLGESFVQEAQQAGFSTYNYMEIEAGAQKDARIHLEAGRDAYVRSAYVLNHRLSSRRLSDRFLQSLPPVQEVLDLMAPVRRENEIGVHVRMEAGVGLDHNTYDSTKNWSRESHEQLHYWRAKSHFSHFIKRLEALTEQGRTGGIFLAADRPEIYDEFQARFGDRLAFIRRDVFDRSKEQIQYALADVLMLARCRMLLGSTWSSFSELALRLSTRFDKIEMSGKDF